MLKPKELPWGQIIFLILTLVSCADLVSRGSSGHFDIFRNSARILWEGQNPYGTLYPSAYYLYSPFCGMSIFSLFAWLPYKIDLALYTLFSCLTLFWALKTFSKMFLSEKGPWAELLFVVVAFEMIGSVLNAKLEIAMSGILILSCIRTWKNPRSILGPILLAVICNWKFQTLPTVGLLFLGQIIARKQFRSSFVFALSFVACFLLPGLFLGFPKLLNFHAAWKESLMGFMLGGQNNWLGFQHIYQSIRTFFGYSLSYTNATYLSAAIAAALALIWLKKLCSKTIKPSDLLFWPFVLGSAYACTLSPLSQSAGFILATPLLGVSICVLSNKKRGWMTLCLFAICLYGVVGIYSDLTPKSLRVLLKTMSFKSLSLIALTLLCFHLSAWTLNTSKSRAANNQ
ncbi:DUF2029 domain-containing protein [bacterium]|nr:DUF2029 domain-containing protein [bacterium]